MEEKNEVSDPNATSSEYNTAQSEEDKITLFAPFEVNKSHTASSRALAVLHRSSEADSELWTNSREIEFRESETQYAGNARVLFRKLKAAVSSSGGSSSSYSPISTPSPSQLSNARHRIKRRCNLEVSVNIPPPEGLGERGHLHYGRFSPTSSISSSNMASSSGGRDISGEGITVERSVREDQKISLTSYSDAHQRMVDKGSRRGGKEEEGGGGGAVNKTEMLKRFGNIADSKVQDTTTDLKKYWMPDKACKECSNCNVKFSIFVRRHHCRICGRIFCHSCCSITIPGALLRPDLQGNLRTCKDCCEVFNEFRLSKMEDKSVQPSDSITIDHTPSSSYSSKIGVESPQPLHGSGNFGRTLSGPRPATMSILSPHKSWDEGSSGGRSQEIMDLSPSRTTAIEFDNPTPSRRRLSSRKPTNFDSISAKSQRESVMILDEDEIGFIASSIWTKFLDPTFGIARSNHRHRLRTFPDSYTGASIVGWLLSNGYIASRYAGAQVGQVLVDTKRLRIASSADSEFRDEMNQFLELGEAALLPMEDGKSPIVRDAPKWFQHLPQESDSEYEVSRCSLNETYPSAHIASTRLGPSPSSSSTTHYDHSVTLSSISKLTCSHDSSKGPHKPSQDDYLIVGDDLMNKSHDSSIPGSPHSTPSPISTLCLPSSTTSATITKSHPTFSSITITSSPSKSQLTQPSNTLHPNISPTPKSRYFSSYVTKPSVTSFHRDGKYILDSLPPSDGKGGSGGEGEESSSGLKTCQEVEQVFQKMYYEHFDALLTQLIKSYGLSLSWLDVLQPLIVEATQTVRTDVFAKDVMDINEYVRVKKIPCGQRTDSSFTYGVVCSKNVTHKKMPTEISNPTVLLLKCAFEFQRRENQLSSFDTLHLQEHKYLSNLVEKVRAFRPSIILVQKSVSRLALEDLFNLGIVVAVNVKPSVMLRVARCTRAEIMTSLDQLFFNVRLGTCGKFYLHNFTLESGIKKTLMYFDVCEPRLGCVIALRGGTNRELKKVKKVTQFGLHLAYNSFLESSFLLDEFAWPGKVEDSREEEDEGVCLTSEPYSSSCSTPEVPLYPSLAYPLDSLSPSELVKRLDALGLCKTKESEALATVSTTQGEEGGDRGNSLTPQLAGVTREGEDRENSSTPQLAIVSSEGKDRGNSLTPLLAGVTSEAFQSGPDIVSLQQVLEEPDIEKQENTIDTDPITFSIGITSQAQVDSHADSNSGHNTLSDSHANIEESHTKLTGNDNYMHSPRKIESEQALTQVDSNITVQDPVSRLESVGVGVLANLAETEFKAALGRQLISVSPRVKFKVPYLQTAAGREADVRQYLSCVIYWSVQFTPKLRGTLAAKRIPGKIDRDVTDEQGLVEMQSTKKLMEDIIFSDVMSGYGTSSGDPGIHSQIRSQSSVHSYQHQPSYKSISEHPLTSSFLLLRANTNEMQAALADFRARAGVKTEDNSFFFKSAKFATNYRLLLQNVFNKYKQFEVELEEEEDEGEAEGNEEVERGRRRRRKSNWWKRKVRNERSNAGVCESVCEVTHTGDALGPLRESCDSDDDDDKDVGGITLMLEAVEKKEEEKDEEVILTSKEDDLATKSLEVVSGEHTPRISRSGRSSHEFGTMVQTGSLVDMDHTPSCTTGKDMDECLPDCNLDSYSDTWLGMHQHMDCLDPIKHQGISILFSNTCHDGQKHQRPCLSPCVIPMFYYGHNDIAIGDFLQRYCFRENYRCQTCCVDMAKHIRHIIHGPRAIHIEIENTGASASKDDSIYTWLECSQCHHATPYTSMTTNSLLFSFAKFLELKFYSDSYVTRSHGSSGGSPCSHFLHPDYSQCFLFRNKLATFRPSTIGILELLLPPCVLCITTPSNKYHHDYASDIKHVGRIVEGVFYRIRQKLDKYRLEPVAGLINDHISNSKCERDAMRTKVKHLKEMMVSGGFLESKGMSKVELEDGRGGEEEKNMINVQDCLEDLKRSMTEVVECWNILLEDLDARVREYRRRLREGGGGGGGEVVMMTENFSRSPRGSPVAILHPAPDRAVTSMMSSTSLIHTPAHTPPTDTHLPNTPTNLSSDFQAPRVMSSRVHRLSDKKHADDVDLPLEITPILMSRKLMHERNFSDVGCVGKDVTMATKEKVHRRNLSDSLVMGEPTLEQCSSVLMPSSETLVTMDMSLTHGDDVGSLLEADDEIQKGEVEGGGVVEEEDAVVYLREKKMDISYDDQPSSSSAVLREEISGGQVGEDSHADNSGGFLAKFRPKEQEGRDDPTKYYLLDPCFIITGSSSSPKLAPNSSGSNSRIFMGGNGTHNFTMAGSRGTLTKRHSRGSRIIGANTLASTAETFADGGSKVDRKLARDKDRLSIISRPFQRLPPPFEYNEHHTMHNHSIFPIAIYEKEPTSIIAYALSSRDYAAELKVLTEKKGGVAEARSAQNFSPKLKRNFSDMDKTTPTATPNTTTTSGTAGGNNSSKGFFSELKKKGSAINIFSGLSSSTNNPHTDVMVDPFEQSSESFPRKLESTSSSSGQSVRSGDLGSEVVSSSATTVSAVPSSGNLIGPTVGGVDELDPGGKNREHISLEFSNMDKTASFFCKVYLAEQFRQLREKIFPGGEDRFIRSLTRCVKYDAKGGKSHSAFCKVADDRFILKQIKSIEISAFEDFAPRYLDYVTKALEKKRPLTLAKILGAYSIGFRNSKTGNSKRMDVVVMENLLYNHSIAKVFDLKGSMRSRYVDPSKDNSGDVLLDENYLNSICHAPVYVYPHSKFVLMQAIMADSEFLAQNSIMDYSLLTCIDDNAGMLVVGIIATLAKSLKKEAVADPWLTLITKQQDYVRTFTFDKRLEMYLKKTSGRELPTVVYPELYRKRFCDAMERYFTVVPDKWSGLGMDF